MIMLELKGQRGQGKRGKGKNYVSCCVAGNVSGSVLDLELFPYSQLIN